MGREYSLEIKNPDGSVITLEKGRLVCIVERDYIKLGVFEWVERHNFPGWYEGALFSIEGVKIFMDKSSILNYDLPIIEKIKSLHWTRDDQQFYVGRNKRELVRKLKCAGQKNYAQIVDNLFLTRRKDYL